MFQRIGPPLVCIRFPVSHRQPPHRQNTIDIIADPGVGVVAMIVDSCTGGKQPRDRVLPGEDNRIDLVVKAIETGFQILRDHKVMNARYGVNN